MTPWKCGRVLVWDVTCPDTFAPSHVMLATSEAGAAIETAGAFGQETLTFLQELGHRLQVKTGEPLLHHHLLHRIVVAMQRGNTAAVLGAMTVPTNDFDYAYTYS